MIPEDQILLASNAPKFPPANLVGVSSYRPCVSEASSNEIPSSNRSEPLCIFTILELTAKYLGHEKMEEIQDFSKQLVKNSKAFLYGPSNVQGRDSKQKVTDKVKKKKSDSFWLLLVYQIFVCVLVFLTERLLKYLDILDLQDHYFCFIVLSIAQLITVLLFLWFFDLHIIELRHDKTNKMAVRPVWSESSLSAWRKLGSLATHWVHSEDSDQTGHIYAGWAYRGSYLYRLFDS